MFQCEDERSYTPGNPLALSTSVFHCLTISLATSAIFFDGAVLSLPTASPALLSYSTDYVDEQGSVEGGNEGEKKNEILTLRIPSVTFFSFNKARMPRVSYTNDNQQTKSERVCSYTTYLLVDSTLQLFH